MFTKQDEKKCEGPCFATVIEKHPPCPLQCGSRVCKSYKEKPKVDLRDHVIVWLYGGPNSGKSTLCQKVMKKYQFTRVHVGDLLKAEIASGSVRARCLRNAVERGELVPNDIAIMLLKREIEDKANGTPGFIIEGFPREDRQGMLFEKNIAPCTIIIFLDATKETLTTRTLGTAAKSQKRWPDERRNDNCVEGKMQLHIFYKHHKHIFDQYPHKIIRINADGRSPDEVFADVDRALEKAVAKKKKQTELRKKKEEEWKAKEPQPKPSVPL